MIWPIFLSIPHFVIFFHCRRLRGILGGILALHIEYDMPHLQRSFDATKATARKITTWLAPSSILLQLGSATLSPTVGHQGGRNGHHGYSHSHANHVHVPSHQHPGSIAPPPSTTAINLGTTSLSPHVFHSLPGTAEGAAGGAGGPSSRAAGAFHHHHQHQKQPTSPHHHHPHPSFGGGGMGSVGNFLYGLGDAANSLGGFKSPAEAAALLFCHSALDVTWIHLNTARRSISPSSQIQQSVAAQGSSAGGGSGEFYRPPPPQQNRSSSSPSNQTPQNGPGSAAAIYQHHPHAQQQQTHPHPQASTPQVYHQQQHHVYGSYNIAAPVPSQQQQPSLSIPPAPAVSGPNSGGTSTTAQSPWTWPPENDSNMVGIEAMSIPPWISTSGPTPGTSHSHSFHTPYAQQASQHPQYTFPMGHIPTQHPYAPQPSPPTPIDVAGVELSGKSSLEAAREIADLASTAMALPAIFGELDMMIGVREFVD